MITILRLTNSDDFNERIPPQARGDRVAQETFCEQTGEEATTVARRVWPTPALPDIVSGWLDEYRPDLVLFRVSAYWVTFESVPLMMSRRLGRAGGPVAAAGQRVAQVRWLGETRAFHLARRTLLRAVGGAANFTVPEVVSVTESVFRRVLARESTVLVMRGPETAVTADTSAWGLARAEARRRELNRGLVDLCRRLHVHYTIREDSQSRPDDASFFLGDMVHANTRLHRIRGENEGRAMADAWLAARS